MLNVKKATVIRIQGTEVVNTKEYDKETFDIEQHIEEEENSNKSPVQKFVRAENV